MSGKISEIDAHLASAHQLEAVIGAMRGIAAARAHEAHGRLAGVRALAATVGEAIGSALADAPPERPQAGAAGAAEPGLTIVLCPEQGFVGALNERLIERAIASRNAQPCEYMLVGSRSLVLAQERDLPVTWFTPMVSHTDHVVALAGRMADALYERLEHRHPARVSVIHALPLTPSQVEIVERTLIPFDFARFHVEPRAPLPLFSLPPRRLLAGLVELYVFAELCEATMLSIAAENEARVQAMMVAGENMKERLGDLLQRSRQVRQDEITSEIVELASGVLFAGQT